MIEGSVESVKNEFFHLIVTIFGKLPNMINNKINYLVRIKRFITKNEIATTFINEPQVDTVMEVFHKAVLKVNDSI